jgi:hypothetical protein
MRILCTLLLAMLTVTPVAAAAEPCTSNVEEYRYSWRVRGGLRWIAGLVFPTSGVGNLKTAYPTSGRQVINSELLITTANGKSGGFYHYESQMDESGQRTLETYHGYAWGEKSRQERTVFDYVKHLARIRKQTPEKVENKIRPIPESDLRDILTAIHFMRQNAARIRGPIQTSIYSDGKEYPVIFRPAERAALPVMGKRTNALAFEIVDAPGGKKWPGGVKIWLSDDERRIPVRIEIRQSLASLQLDLQSVESCAVLQAAR